MGDIPRGARKDKRVVQERKLLEATDNQTHSQVTKAAQERGGLSVRPRVRLGAVIALAVAAGFIAWLVINRSDDSSTSGSTSPTTTAAASGPTAGTSVGPVSMSRSGLATLARALNRPIYWAGPKARYTYEFTQTSEGNLFVRYLPPGVKVGDKRARFLIIATYPYPDSFAGLKRVAGGKEIAIPHRGIAVVDVRYAKSVHVAFQGIDYQVEVYDPSPKRALEVAVSGNLQPVR